MRMTSQRAENIKPITCVMGFLLRRKRDCFQCSQKWILS